MPDSPPSTIAARARKRSSSEPRTADEPKVSADNYSVGGSCLAAPPRDVGRMLERYGTALPRYLDVHRQREIDASHQRWPLLRPTRRHGESGG